MNGINRFKPTDYSDFNHSGIAPENSPWNVNFEDGIYYSEHSGDNSTIPMDWNKSQKVFVKISIHPFSKWRLNISSNYENSQFQNYEHIFKYKPTGRATNYAKSNLNSLKLSHLVNPRLSHVITISSLNSWSAKYLYENPLDNRYVTDRYYSYAGGFIAGGMDKTHEEQWLKNNSLSWNLSSQINYEHAIKMGFNLVQHKIENNPKNLITCHPLMGINEMFCFRLRDQDRSARTSCAKVFVFTLGYVFSTMPFSSMR